VSCRSIGSGDHDRTAHGPNPRHGTSQPQGKSHERLRRPLAFVTGSHVRWDYVVDSAGVVGLLRAASTTRVSLLLQVGCSRAP